MTSETCRNCALELKDKVTEQAIKIAVQDERLDAEARAREVALSALQQWQASANEWRGAMMDLTGKFLTRELYDTQHATLVKRIEDSEKLWERSAGKSGALNATWIVGAGIIGIIIGIVSLIMHYIK